MCNKREYLHFILDLLLSTCGNQVLSVGDGADNCCRHTNLLLSVL